MLKSASTCPSMDATARSMEIRIGKVDLMKIVDLEGRPAFVESDDISPQLGELTHHMFADTRRTSGHHRTAAVVAPQLVDLSQGSTGLRSHLRCFLGALRRLDAALVDLRHGLGDLAGGEAYRHGRSAGHRRSSFRRIAVRSIPAAAPRPSR